MEVRSLKGLALAVTVLVILDALGTPATMLWLALSPDYASDYLSDELDFLTLASLAVKLVTFIVFGRWIYVAGDNLARAGYDGLDFTPGARIWWFAVPLANLVQPFIGMRELWNASHGEPQHDTTPALLGIWWALWLVNAFAPYTAALVLPNQGLTAILAANAIADILLATAALMIVQGITDAQRRLTSHGLEEVFA